MKKIVHYGWRIADWRAGAGLWFLLAASSYGQSIGAQIQQPPGAQPPDPTPTPIPEIKDIVPPLYIPLLPLWAWIAITIVATLLVAWLVFAIVQRIRAKGKPPAPPRTTALAELQALEPEIESENPVEFTVETAGVLRKYVVGQFGIPATRQTSQEFLQSLRESGRFSNEDRDLLKAFLDKADLIEFAKFQASSQDSRELWEEAKAFVQGSGQHTPPQPPPLPPQPVPPPLPGGIAK